MNKNSNTMGLSQAALEARRAAKRAWYAANKDRVKEANRKYWERKAASLQKDDSPHGDGGEHDAVH